MKNKTRISNFLKEYLQLFENINDIILVFDGDENILEANNAAIKTYGYTYQELTSLKTFHLQDNGFFLPGFANTDNGIKYDAFQRRRDGSLFPVEVNLNSLSNIRNNLYVGLIRDISERRKVEKKLLESEKRYRSLFSNMGEAFLYAKIVCDEGGKPIDYIVQEVNEAFERMSGYKREQLLGRKATEVNPEIKNSEPNLVMICGEVALTGGKNRFELTMYPLGKTYIVSSYSPEPGYFVNIFSDVTEQKRAEEEIRKLSSALEQSSAIAIITNTEGIVEYINPKFTLITGYTLEEASGRNIDFISSGRMTEKISLEMWQSLRKGEDWQGEFLNKKKSGEFFWVSASISPIRDQSGKLTHYVSIQEDITDKKRMQQELQKNNKKLKKAVKELRLMQEIVIQQEKLAGIGQLAAGVAHEINNPLGFVLSNFNILNKYFESLRNLITTYQTLKQTLKNNENSMIGKHLLMVDILEEKSNIDYILEDIDDIFNDCTDGLNRIKNIVTGLGLFVRSEQQGKFKDYNINMGIESTLVVAHNELKHRSEVVKDLKKVPLIAAAGQQINQVLLNIIVNAVQAITAKNPNSKGKIKIKTYCDDRYVYCEISDNGIGISNENIKKIFNPFFTTKPVGQGTGLGLSISYNIITKNHNGQLTVKSEFGKETIFTIKLPIVNKKTEFI